MKTRLMICLTFLATVTNGADRSYPIVDTGQIRCYNSTTEVKYPRVGLAYFGQDAHYSGNQPSYKDNGDGTVTDLITGLMWTQDPGQKKTYSQILADVQQCKVGGHTNWRLPTIKELYSLILFNGTDPDPMSTGTSAQRPFIDSTVFKFQYGNAEEGDRIIDSQFASSTLYRSTTMKGDKTVFGVNFADGRIKGYGLQSPRGEKTFYTLYVRGNPLYGKNDFHDNDNGTITDKATGLTWMQTDSGTGMNWKQALEWAEDLEHAGHSDWRLPSAKELQSIVDYSRCPDVTQSAAIDPIFKVTALVNESGQKDYAFYWTSTSHCSASNARAAAYIAFGRSSGWMQDRQNDTYQLLDVHGAGSQRSDPKMGSATRYPRGRGPQGDVIRIRNLVRCVRGGKAVPRTTGPEIEMKRAPRNTSNRTTPRSGQQGRQRPSRVGAGQGQGSSGAEFVRRLDKDGDGKVSKQEFDGPAQHFTQFDRNKDGYLSQAEAPQGPPPQQNNGRRR